MHEVAMEHLPMYQDLMDKLQETESTHCTNVIGDFDHSWGCVQTGKLAIYDVANKHKEKYGWLKSLPINRLKSLMVRDDRLNMTIGVLYFEILLKRHKSIDKAIMAYNTLKFKNGKYNYAYLRRVLSKRR